MNFGTLLFVVSVAAPKASSILKKSSSLLRLSLFLGLSKDASEEMPVVTEMGNVVTEYMPRSSIRLNNLPHRATYIFVRRPSDNKLFVQRRSSIKDYCPNMLDPTPGGCVGKGESYAQNAERELEEEMGLKDVPLKRLFTFHYKDERTNCWGDCWDCEVECEASSINYQKSEVSEVLLMSVDELLSRRTEVTADGIHALRLYLQFKAESGIAKNQSRDNYRLRPKALLFDCDDCLYFDDWKIADILTANIERWCTETKKMKPGYAYELYKKYGTALKGMQQEGYINNEKELDDYLQIVHSIPDMSLRMKKNEKLLKMLQDMDPTIPRFIFTASVRRHAEHVLQCLGISSCFVDIIDTRSCDYATKHSAHAFECAAKMANVNSEDILFFDGEFLVALSDVEYFSPVHPTNPPPPPPHPPPTPPPPSRSRSHPCPRLCPQYRYGEKNGLEAGPCRAHAER